MFQQVPKKFFSTTKPLKAVDPASAAFAAAANFPIIIAPLFISTFLGIFLILTFTDEPFSSTIREVDPNWSLVTELGLLRDYLNLLNNTVIPELIHIINLPGPHPVEDFNLVRAALLSALAVNNALQDLFLEETSLVQSHPEIYNSVRETGVILNRIFSYFNE